MRQQNADITRPDASGKSWRRPTSGLLLPDPLFAQGKTTDNQPLRSRMGRTTVWYQKASEDCFSSRHFCTICVGPGISIVVSLAEISTVAGFDGLHGERARREIPPSTRLITSPVIVDQVCLEIVGCVTDDFQAIRPDKKAGMEITDMRDGKPLQLRTDNPAIGMDIGSYTKLVPGSSRHERPCPSPRTGAAPYATAA